MSDVPCNGCRACCTKQVVIVVPEDEPNLEVFKLRDLGKGVQIIDVLENGDCAHLGPDGCTIYGRRPAVCVAYDCRLQFLMMNRAERRTHSSPGIWREARKRLNTVDESDQLGAYKSKMDRMLLSAAEAKR